MTNHNIIARRLAVASALALGLAGQSAFAQEVSVNWVQHINGNSGVAPANLLPILKKGGSPVALGLQGRDVMDGYSQLIRYDANRLLLGIRENGINENASDLSPADRALSEAYPDRSLVWLDANTGRPLGVAWKESLNPAADIGIDVTAEGGGSQGAAFYAWWRVGLEDGVDGQRALYSAFRHIIFRYAPKAGGGWETTPTIAYQEQVRGVGDGLSNGDGFNSWRFRDFHVRGSGTNTTIFAGGGTWRAGHHPQVLKTSNGLTFAPVGRVDNRDNGARRNDYALGGLSSFPLEQTSTYGDGSKISVVIASHFPGTGWEARPNRYSLNPNNPTPTHPYNEQPNVGLYRRNETSFGGLPAFAWEAAGLNNRPLTHAVDGVDRYDGNWTHGLQTHQALDYIVAYSGPSWNNQFGAIKKPAWLAVHRLDGSIASGNSSVKLPFTEADEIIETQPNTGHDYLYDPWINIYPDPTVPGKAEVLVSFGSTGFGSFTIQNVAAQLVSSPASQTVTAGANTEVTFTAGVTGSPNSFQWFRNGVALQNVPKYLGTTRHAVLKIKGVDSADAGAYQLRWTNPISGAGQTVEANLVVNGNANLLTAALVTPTIDSDGDPSTPPTSGLIDESGAEIPIAPGSVNATGAGTFNIVAGGLFGFSNRNRVGQPGDLQQFNYEAISGDFDKSVKITSITSNVAGDTANNSGGLAARVSMDALSPSFFVNVTSPGGANNINARGRVIQGQNLTTFSRDYPGVGDVLPNQWIRLRRVGNYLAAYVGTNGTTWTLIAERWNEWPSTLLVGTYAQSAGYKITEGVAEGNLTQTTVGFASYGNTMVSDTTRPTILSAGTTDKTTIGVKFSETLNSASVWPGTGPVNYKLSQGRVTNARLGIGGDSLYLTVEGLTADTFTLTILGGLTDSAGNVIASNSTITGKVSDWNATDIGLIQSGDPEIRTPGDDPFRKGAVVAVSSGDTETELEIVGGGSNAWNPGDYLQYTHKNARITGNFDVMVEVSRNDRPANTAGWANSGLMLREAAYIDGKQYSNDGTKAAMVAVTTYIEADAPGRSAIPLFRAEPEAGYGNGAPVGRGTVIGGVKGYYPGLNGIDAAGNVDAESSSLSARWLRIKRAANTFTFLNSHDGKTWNEIGSQELPLANSLLFGFSTMSDTGGNAPPGNAYAGNGHHTEDGSDLLEGNQNLSNYSVQRIRIGTSVAPREVLVNPTVTASRNAAGNLVLEYIGVLQSADSINGPFTDVSGATSPRTVVTDGNGKFYRARR